MATVLVESPPLSPFVFENSSSSSSSSSSAPSPTRSLTFPDPEVPTATLAERFASALSDVLSSCCFSADEKSEGPYGLGEIIRLHSGLHLTHEPSTVQRQTILHWTPEEYNTSPTHQLLWIMHDKMRRNHLHQMVPSWSEAAYKLLEANSKIKDQKRTEHGVWITGDWVAPDVRKAAESIQSVARQYLRANAPRARPRGSRYAANYSLAPSSSNATLHRGRDNDSDLWRPEIEIDPEMRAILQPIFEQLERDARERSTREQRGQTDGSSE